jgi:hypothetical protein
VECRGEHLWGRLDVGDERRSFG